MPSFALCHRRSGLLAIVWTVSLFSAGTAAAQAPESPLLDQADALKASGRYEQVAALLRPALRSAPDSFDLLWRLSDTLCDWARIGPAEEAEARYDEALALARRAVDSDPFQAQGWFQVGKAKGRLALFKGGREKVEMSREVKDSFEKALSLQSDHASALHGLARWHREVANLSWVLRAAARVIYGGLPPASNEDSERLFLRAIQLEPDNIAHYLELGKTYLEMNAPVQARPMLERAVALPATRPDDPEWQQEARDLLARLRR
jgi:tetratricopeptide (TPR) repeat protein